MALTLTKHPELYSLSGNPVIVEISTDTTGVNFHKLHIKITFDGELKGEDALPVINGKAEFDISDYLKTKINGHFSIDENTHIINIVKDYQFEYFETYENDGSEHDNANSDIYKVMQGKIDFLNLLKLNNSSETFKSKFYDDNKALTLRANDNRYVNIDENDIIYLFKTRDTSSGYRYHIKIKVKNKDNSINYYYYELPDAIKLYKIPWGFNNLLKELINSDKIADIFSYQLLLQRYNFEIVPIHPTFLFGGEFILTNKPIQKTLILKNSLGVYEVFNFYGKSEELNKYTRQISEQNNSDLILDGSHKKSFKANTGWISKNEYDNLLLLLKSKDSYVVEDGNNIQIVIKTAKTKKHKSDEFLYSLEVDYDYAHNDYF